MKNLNFRPTAVQSRKQHCQKSKNHEIFYSASVFGYFNPEILHLDHNYAIRFKIRLNLLQFESRAVPIDLLVSEIQLILSNSEIFCNILLFYGNFDYVRSFSLGYARRPHSNGR